MPVSVEMAQSPKTGVSGGGLLGAFCRMEVLGGCAISTGNGQFMVLYRFKMSTGGTLEHYYYQVPVHCTVT